jgi:hypothetical protein
MDAGRVLMCCEDSWDSQVLKGFLLCRDGSQITGEEFMRCYEGVYGAFTPFLRKVHGVQGGFYRVCRV